MKKYNPTIQKGLCVVIFFLLSLSGWQAAVSAEDKLIFPDLKKREFFDVLFEKVSKLAAAQAYDYKNRPRIRTAIVNFQDSSGQETVLGKELADYLRLKFSLEQQFVVYGREEAIGLTLQSLIQKDPKFGTGVQRAFQESQAFSRTPVDLVITGLTQKEEDSRIKVLVHLIPLFERVSALAGELNRINYQSLQYLSPPQSPEEIQKALAWVEKPKRKLGRLIILSRLESPGSRSRLKEEPMGTGSYLETGSSPFPGEFWKLGSLNEISCWLDEEEIKILKREEWEESRKRVYRNILSGFNATQVWLDQDLAPGDHTLMVSLFPVNGLYKTFKQSFQIKEATTYYMFFSLGTDIRKEPTLQVKVVADTGNALLPF